MKRSTLFVAFASTAVLSACGGFDDPSTQGYSAITPDAVKQMPAEPIDVIYGYSINRVSMRADSPYECFAKATALYGARALDIVPEDYNSTGNAVCMGKNGIVLLVSQGQAYTRLPGVMPSPSTP